ncbi:hypothetical protein N665_1074s0002 [Sinapis alba]|nr:hypothetical protein N665_1074s0002 [Sinapis alba]
MTSFFSWNMRVFKKPHKHLVVRKWIQSEKPLFVFLIETRVQESKCKEILKSALPGWNSITNYDYHRLGCICAQIITCIVQADVVDHFIFSANYGSNFIADKRQLWANIIVTYQAYKHLSLPWILLGDYNSTFSSTEHSRMQDYLGDQSGMSHFQEIVTDCALTDFAYSGSLFTWWKRGNGDFLSTVNSKWEESGHIFHSRTALNMFRQKLKSLKYAMQEMNINHYGDLQTQTQNSFENLCLCQEQALSDPSHASFRAAEEASKRWHHLALVEEKFLMQKSRIQWLTLGDQNTTFYHHAVQDHGSQITSTCCIQNHEKY